MLVMPDDQPYQPIHTFNGLPTNPRIQGLHEDAGREMTYIQVFAN
jgi:hypothetical protein